MQLETEEETRQRMKQFYADLETAPEFEITGVAIRGAGGGISRGEELWTMTFELAAWRINEGELLTSCAGLQSGKERV